MHSRFRGEVIYQAETDVHFPQLTVGETLQFAALARTPRNRLPGISRQTYAQCLGDVVMAVFGISHTLNTKVGNDWIRGVSGGERKRVSIAEVTLNQSSIQCWDNSTRGLDSATALEFTRTLRLSTEIANTSAVVAIYQASQLAYDVCPIPQSSRSAQPLTNIRNSTRSPYCTKDGRFTLAQRIMPSSISPTWDIIVRIVRLRLISSHPSLTLRSVKSSPDLKDECHVLPTNLPRLGSRAKPEPN